MEEVRKYLIPFSGPFKREFSIKYFEGDPFKIIKSGYCGMMNSCKQVTEDYSTVEEAEQALLRVVMERGIKELHDLAEGLSKTSITIQEMQEKGLASFLVPKDK